SVKSQIGHSKCAAGIAGMIKIAKALHHRVLPPTGQITTPNAAYRIESNPFQLNRKPAPWLPHAPIARAAVSAFGFGGTNFHAVLGAYPAHQSAVGAAQLPAELFAVRAANQADAQALLRELAAFIDASDAALNLRDLARTLWEMGEGPTQIAFVATDLASLGKRIAAALLPGVADPGIYLRSQENAVGKVAFLFSGQGSQYPGMLRDLLVYFPPRAELLAAGRQELSRIYPATAYDEATRKQQQQDLTDTRITQPALGLVEQAAFEWLKGLGIKPDMSAGHSYGELVALATAGAFDAQTLLQLSRARAEAIISAIGGDDNGAMAAVRLDVDNLGPLLAGFPDVVMANHNSPIQTVISGPSADVEAACAFLGQNNIGYKRIDTSCAFHSPMMAAAETRYAEALRGHAISALQWPVYSNVSAAPHANDGEQIRESLAHHIVSPVRFVAEIERMYADGARLFLEVGPRKVLTGLVGRILKDQNHTAMALDSEDRGFVGLLETVAQLAVLMPGFDATALHAARAQKLDLSKPRKLAPTTWMVNGGRAWPLKGASPSYAAAVVTQPVIEVANAMSGSPTTTRIAAPAAAITAGDQALAGYLANMREMVHAQRDVLLGYFGAPGAQVAVRATERSTVVATIAATPEPARPSVAAVANAAPAAPDSQQVLLSIVSERTGYPADMLDPDLDLEADLSIDSIKRQEIIGELSQRMSLRALIGAGADALLEQLAAQKTLRAMSQWLLEKLPAPSAPARAAEAAAPAIETQVPALAAMTAAPAAKLPVGQMLLDIISQSTGYPPESLDPDLDLEADLSIDSIKRQEIVGQLCTRIGVEAGSEKDAMLEQLSSLKTLRAMTTWLEQRYAAPAEPLSTVNTPSDASSGIPLERYILRHKNAPLPRLASDALKGKNFLISDDRLGLAPRVAALLQARGVHVTIVDFPSAKALPANLDQIDGLVHLWSLNPASRLRDVKRLFAVARDALQKKGRHILVASTLRRDFGSSDIRSESSHGAGLAGLVKTVVKEFPGLRARWVDFDLNESLDVVAGYIEQELLDESLVPEVAYQAGQRFVREVVPTELTSGSLDGLPLTPDSTVLLTGGARGITALIAIELARRYRCHLEIVGRSSMPTQEEQELTRGIDDPRKLRQVLLLADPKRKPAEIEQMTRGILADRAARETYAQVIAAGGSLNYVKLDVRDSKAFMHFIDDVYARRGRIDGVIHGAGVVEDKLVRDKTDESFGRVFDTKVRGAMVLNRRIRDDVKFVVFFSSVASAFGNRGQVDYASANDVLDKLAHSWQHRISGRVLSVNWGPWADTGMVSESLKNEYHRKGIGLIPQREGVDALLRELSNLTGDPQILLMCGKPENFDGRGTAHPQEATA
ncbi:MAG: SDR family NAD(P)-dependent oxidoreductase, partial [Cupriavidus sp.]